MTRLQRINVHRISKRLRSLPYPFQEASLVPFSDGLIDYINSYCGRFPADTRSKTRSEKEQAIGKSKKAVERRGVPLVVQWCGRCRHATKAFYVPHHGLCVHCYHHDKSVSGESGWETLRRYKESNCDCGSWESRDMHNTKAG